MAVKDPEMLAVAASTEGSDSLGYLFQGTLDEHPCTPITITYQPHPQPPSAQWEIEDNEAARMY